MEDYEEREEIRDRAVTIFNENSQALYNSPGRLIIDIEDSGYKFDIDIERADSDGFKHMKVFCYDLMLAQVWSSRSSNPGFLIHDSSIFADVDERQVASALDLACTTAEDCKFQYICCMNSDRVPWDLLEEQSKLRGLVRLTLKDDPPEESLFGLRF